MLHYQMMMKKQVLLAIDMKAPAVWAASYALQLAALLADICWQNFARET
jgi:hypothetical protein